MDALLKAENLSAGYGHDVVVNGASFEIRSGEFCALLGLNGCGKSTLFKTMCGLLPALDGRCLVNGLEMADLNERRRAQLVSCIPQRTSHMEGITALDVVCMGYNPRLSLFESVSAKARRQAVAAMERMGVSGLARKDFSRVSEGQKQLIVLSRALVQDTPVMLLDEPDRALDFHNRHRILDSIRRLSRQEKKAVLITLHDPNMALAYCDRLILLHQGRIAGQIEPIRTQRDEICRLLSCMYGDITVSFHGEHIHVWKNNHVEREMTDKHFS